MCAEIRRKGMEAIFFATLPLESLRALVAKAASEVPLIQSGRPAKADLYKIMLVDVSRVNSMQSRQDTIICSIAHSFYHVLIPWSTGAMF